MGLKFLGWFATAFMIATSGAVVVTTTVEAEAKCIENPSCEQHFPDSSTTRIDPWSLNGLAAQTLWEARNEIYARNGHRFRTARAQRFFGNKRYYRARTSNVSLNAVEQANVEMIKAFEDGRGSRYLASASRQSAPPAAFTPSAGDERVIVSGLNLRGDGFLSVRAGPGTGYTRVGKLTEGAVLAVEGKSGVWRKVRTPTGTGWVHSNWLAPAPPAPTTARATSTITVIADASSASATQQATAGRDGDIVLRVPTPEAELSDDDRRAINGAQEDVAALTAQIETLKTLLEEQRAATDTASDDRDTVGEMVVALTARIGELEERQDNARKVLARYGTPVRPDNANLLVDSRRASESFPKIPYFKPGVSTVGEMWVEPVVTDTGVLTFQFNFIDPEAQYETVAATIVMSLEELRRTEEALRRVQNWNRTARAQRIRKRFDKEATCFPDTMCAERIPGNASTSIVFQIDDDGATETQIVRNKGAYREPYGYSMESALLLISYLQHVEKEGSFDYEAGTQTRESLDALFE